MEAAMQETSDISVGEQEKEDNFELEGFELRMITASTAAAKLRRTSLQVFIHMGLASTGSTNAQVSSIENSARDHSENGHHNQASQDNFSDNFQFNEPHDEAAENSFHVSNDRPNQCSEIILNELQTSDDQNLERERGIPLSDESLQGLEEFYPGLESGQTSRNNYRILRHYHARSCLRHGVCNQMDNISDDIHMQYGCEAGRLL
jgi:hypothetical protein